MVSWTDLHKHNGAWHKCTLLKQCGSEKILFVSSFRYFFNLHFIVIAEISFVSHHVLCLYVTLFVWVPFFWKWITKTSVRSKTRKHTVQRIFCFAMHKARTGKNNQLFIVSNCHKFGSRRHRNATFLQPRQRIILVLLAQFLISLFFILLVFPSPIGFIPAWGLRPFWR